MAIKIYEQFKPFANPADGDHPYGSFKNDSIPGAEDGTPLDAIWGNDMVGFTDALLAQAGVVPNGVPDKLGASQRVDAMRKMFTNIGTVSDIASGKFKVGTTLSVIDRGYGIFTVIDGGTSNGYDKLPSGFGKTAVLSDNQPMFFEYFGVNNSPVSQDDAYNRAIEYCEDNEIYNISFSSTTKVHISNGIVLKPIKASRVTTFYDTSKTLNINQSGVKFVPLSANITVFKILREFASFDEINVVQDTPEKTGVISVQIGDTSTALWVDNPGLYRGSYSFINILRLLSTNVDTGLIFKPLTLTEGTIGNYYHNIGDVSFRDVDHGIVFDVCPTGDNQTTRTFIKSYNHNGGHAAIIGLNFETTKIASFHAENISGVSPEYPFIDGNGVYIPAYGTGMSLRNHSITIHGSTENVVNPIFVAADSCEIDVYPVSYNTGTGLQGNFSSGFGGVGSMPPSGPLNEFFFLYQTNRSAVIGSTGDAGAPFAGEIYGNVQWIVCGNTASDEGLQILSVYYPILSTWVRKVKVIDRDNATFEAWERTDAGAVMSVDTNTNSNELFSSVSRRTHQVNFTAGGGGAAASPNGGEFYGVIESIPSNANDGCQLAYGIFPAINKKRIKTGGSWSGWVDL